MKKKIALLARLTASIFLCAAAACTLSPPGAPAEGPLHVYLTWQGDTSRTITVNYHTAERPSRGFVLYDTESRDGDPDSYRFRAVAERRQIEGLPDGRWIHRASLQGLTPDQTYYFIAGDPKRGFSPEKKFHSLPAGRQPIRFVTGGDIGIGPLPRKLFRHAAQADPAFALLGGDIAYVNGDLKAYRQWDTWFDNWEELMVTPDGHTIPMVLAIGNHEVNRSSEEGSDRKRAPFYFGYFPQAPRSFFSRTFGENVVFFMLDSGHVARHDGEQSAWLASELQRYADTPFKFALYHIPLYPSHRDYDLGASELGRLHWAPLFDRYGLTAAFENHDHTYKRSKLLRAGEPDPNGVLYLGDGCFGRGPRTVDDELRWYLDRAGSIAHFWVVDVSSEGVVYRAIDAEGKVFDVYPPEEDSRTAGN